ncbi:MAG: Gfo/Idh/MocA family oxidoreductase, partial [Lachnospiraceae bacterium]|nr:Gfo/Idh/MocA family oxidoreductase [Lachnospiraceae bacterium]
MNKLKFAILAPGGIANSMAEAVSQLEEIECYAVASRNYDRAKSFADKWGFEQAYGSYEEMVQDPQVELIYVASPHSHHYPYAKLCLEHGKHVLLEKAFTVNAKQAEELITLARSNGHLLAEAFWPRYMPSRKMIDDLIAQGVIGEVHSVIADFGAPLTHVERLSNPELAGGALLDLGVYPINLALQI